MRRGPRSRSSSRAEAGAPAAAGSIGTLRRIARCRQAGLAGLLAGLLAFAPAHAAEALQGTVVEVSSGDAMRVDVAGDARPVRLVGLRLPPPRTPQAESARTALARLALGQTAHIQVLGRDVQGRLLARVRVQDLDLARELIRLGHARAGAEADYRQAEAEARAARRGVWRH